MHDPGQAGNKIADNQAGDEGYDKAAFPRKFERPGDAETLELFGGISGKMGIMAQEEATEADPENQGKTQDEATGIDPHGHGADHG